MLGWRKFEILPLLRTELVNIYAYHTRRVC
jgi:hypothetical protein